MRSHDSCRRFRLAQERMRVFPDQGIERRQFGGLHAYTKQYTALVSGSRCRKADPHAKTRGIVFSRKRHSVEICHGRG